jgi:hypothetical protein
MGWSTNDVTAMEEGGQGFYDDSKVDILLTIKWDIVRRLDKIAKIV